MQEHRIHGRGGQGVVTVGHLMAYGFFDAGLHIQSFASHGAERRGAPVTAYVRASEQPLYRRCDVEHPSAVLSFEPTFLYDGSALAGLHPGTVVIVNTVKTPESFAALGPYRFAAVDALSIAREHGLGRIVNTAVLGAWCRATGALSLEAMAAVVRNYVPHRVDNNLEALHKAYEQVQISGEVAASA